MIKAFVYFLIALLLFAFNVGFLKNFLLFGSLPNLLLLLVAYVSLEDHGNFYLVVSLVTGLLLDFATGVFLGSFSLSFLLLAIILRSVSSDIVVFKSNWKFLPLALVSAEAGLFLWVYFFSQIALALGQNAPVFVFFSLGKRFLLETFYSLLFLYPVWKIASLPNKISKKFNRVNY